MNLIAVTDRFARQLEAWKSGHGFSDREALKDLAIIWLEFQQDPLRREQMYGNKKSKAVPVDLGCSSCITDMLTYVYNWRAKLINEVVVEFKGIPQAIIVEEKQTNSLQNKKMHEVRSIAKKMRIPYTNKNTREEIIEKINAVTPV